MLAARHMMGKTKERGEGRLLRGSSLEPKPFEKSRDYESHSKGHPSDVPIFSLDVCGSSVRKRLRNAVMP